MADKTGGPAFPAKRRVDAGANGTITVDASGMTLRDYFAAKAMAFVAARADIDNTGASDWAAACYEIADAMIAARGDA